MQYMISGIAWESIMKAHFYLICSSMVSLYFALIVFGSLFSCIFKRKNDEFILLLRLLLLGFYISLLYWWK